jgi:hypothetical protein
MANGSKSSQSGFHFWKQKKRLRRLARDQTIEMEIQLSAMPRDEYGFLVVRRDIELPDCVLWIITECALAGKTDEQIAREIDVHPNMFEDWKATRVEVRGALRNGREVADRQIIATLYDLAQGYDAEEVQHFMNPRTGAIVQKTRIVEIQPNLRAVEKILNVRQGSLWADPVAGEVKNASYLVKGNKNAGAETIPDDPNEAVKAYQDLMG